MRWDKQKALGKQTNHVKKTTRTNKHKKSKKIPAENAMAMETEEAVEPQLTEEEKAEGKQIRKKANASRSMWKKTGVQISGKNGPRNISGK